MARLFAPDAATEEVVVERSVPEETAETVVTTAPIMEVPRTRNARLSPCGGQSAERHLGHVNAFPLPMPPLARGFALFRRGEAVFIYLRS
jgi:hypothetical protein